jgi:hypothetical protein
LRACLAALLAVAGASAASAPSEGGLYIAGASFSFVVAAERAQQHQIDMQALRAKAGIAAYDDADEDALAERQHIRVQTMRDQIQRLGKELTATQLANEDLCAAVNRLWAENDRLTAQAKLHDEVTTNVGRNFRRVSDELFDRNQEILGLRDYNNRLLRANELLQTTVARSLREVE